MRAAPTALLVSALAAAAACSGAAPPRVERTAGPTEGEALEPPEEAATAAPPLEPAAAGPTEGSCQITSEVERLGTVTVRPQGFEPFDLEVLAATVTVAPGPDPEETSVHVRGALDFHARSAEVALRPAAPLDAAVPMVRLGTDARIERVRASGDGLAGDVAIATGVAVAGVPFGCEGLAVDVPRRRVYVHPVPPEGDTIWVPTGASLTVAESPEGGRYVEMTTEEPTLVPFARLEERGGRVRVRVEYGDGGRIEGWVGAREIREMGRVGYGGWGGSGEGRGPDPGRGFGPGIYEGPARVAGGTTVFGEPGAGPWATVTDEAELRVRAQRGDDHVQLIGVPGLREPGGSPRLSHAFVPATAVTLPPGAF